MRLCQECGRPMQGPKNKKYCSERCYNAHHNRRKKERRGETIKVCCKFNGGVDCTEGADCEECGWNPEVAKMRIVKWNGGPEDGSGA